MAIATVLKTVVRKDLQVRILYPPLVLLTSLVAPPAIGWATVLRFLFCRRPTHRPSETWPRG
jgi:hypothetical protein